MSKVARVLRVLEYQGPVEWIAEQMADRSVKGRMRWYYPERGDSDAQLVQISEAIIGEIPEILEYAAIEADAQRVTERLVCPACGGGANYDPRNCTACSGLGYRDGSGPWPESPAEQMTLKLLSPEDLEYMDHQRSEVKEIQDRIEVLEIAKEILVAREGE